MKWLLNNFDVNCYVVFQKLYKNIYSTRSLIIYIEVHFEMRQCITFRFVLSTSNSFGYFWSFVVSYEFLGFFSIPIKITLDFESICVESINHFG
jgi:hypothetical protein